MAPLLRSVGGIVSLVLEDLIRRSEGLVKRARDLRSYL